MVKAKKINILIPLALLLAMSWASAQTKETSTNTNLEAQLRLLQVPQDFEFKKDTTGFPAFKNATFYAANDKDDVFDINEKNVHLVDVNNDGLKDIVYEETRLHTATVVLVNNGEDFKEVWNGPGKLVAVREAKNTTLSVYCGYVGCMEINLLYEVSVDIKNSISENLLSYHHNTVLGTFDNTFTPKVVAGILRTTPMVDDKITKDPCTGAQRKGNQIRTIENEQVTVIKDDGDWLQVVHTKGNNSIIAWIQD